MSTAITAPAAAAGAGPHDSATSDSKTPAGCGQRLRTAVHDYFAAGHKDIRTPQVLEREKYILFCKGTGSFNRWMLWLPVLIAQICVGSLYSWSIFNKSMDKVWVANGYNTGANANAFTICVALFGLSAAILGSWIERYGPFYAVGAAVILTPAGWAFACLGSWLPNLGAVYAGWGICHGIGAAIVYVSTCSCIQKWFPEFKGLATGIAVMGFGVGSFIWTTVGKSLMDTTGDYKYPVWKVQGIFAIVYLGGLLLALPFMRLPPPNFIDKHLEEMKAISEQPGIKGRLVKALATFPSVGKKASASMTVKEAVSTLEFMLLIPIVFGQFITGVVFLSSAADMTQYIFGYDANFANFITSMLNLCNFTGRVGWGLVSDKIGRKTFYLAATAAQTFAIGLMAVWIDRANFGAWLLSFLLIGSLYGGGFGVLPAFVSDLFGPKISAATHGFLLSVWALATIIGVPVFTSFTGSIKRTIPDPNSTTIPPATTTQPAPEAYIKNSYWLCAMPLMAFVCLLFLNVRPRDRKMRQRMQDLRVRFLCLLCTIKCRLLSDTAAAQEEADTDILDAVHTKQHQLEDDVTHGAAAPKEAAAAHVAATAAVVAAIAAADIELAGVAAAPGAAAEPTAVASPATPVPATPINVA